MRYILLMTFILTSLLSAQAEKKVDFLISRGKYKKVVRYIDKKYKDNKDEEILYNYGFAKENLGKYIDALNCYHLVLRTCPDNGLVLSALGRVYIRLDEYEKAYEFTLRSIIRDSLAENFMIQHANVCLKLNKTSEAKIIFEKFKENKESSALGYVYFRQKQYKKAIPFLIKRLKDFKEDDAAIQLSLCFVHIGQLDSSAYYLSADVSRKKDRLKKAEQIALLLNKKYPENKKIIMFLTNISIEQGELNNAMEYCKLITYMDPNDIASIYKRADIYVLKNEIERAREFYLKGADLMKEKVQGRKND